MLKSISLYVGCRGVRGWRSIEVLCKRGRVGVDLMKVLRGLRREDEALPGDHP